MVVRALLFNILFFGWSATLLLTGWTILWLPSTRFRVFISLWARFIMFLTRRLIGATVEFRGTENIPEGGVVYASKHQSAWDTALFLWLNPHTAYVMKDDLGRIPFWALYTTRCGHILIDRAGGPGALRDMVRKTDALLAENRSVVIFPEGTRSAPGSAGHYHPGVAALYGQTGAKVVPVALNSGLFWPRQNLHKSKGRVIVEFLPTMPEGLKNQEFMARLQECIETATRKLESEFAILSGKPGGG